MSETIKYVERLEELKEGDLARLRRLTGKPLDEAVPGFDLFTGVWWRLRQRSPFAPRRETSWLIAKLYGSFAIPHIRPDPPGAPPTLARLLGQCEPRDERAQARFRNRFDTILCSALPALEPHLHWALSVIAGAVDHGGLSGMDWAQLLDDLSIWDRGEEHKRHRDIRDIWAEEYLTAAIHPNREP